MRLQLLGGKNSQLTEVKYGESNKMEEKKIIYKEREGLDNKKRG